MKSSPKPPIPPGQVRTEITKVPKGVIRILSERCKGCGYCVQFCPKQVLEMSKEYNRMGYHFPVVKNPEECSECKLCYKSCPAGHKIYVCSNSPECIRCLQCQENCPNEAVENQYF